MILILENAILCGDEIRTAGQNVILTKLDWYYIVSILCGDVDNRVQPRTELSYKFAIEWYYISCSQRVLGQNSTSFVLSSPHIIGIAHFSNLRLQIQYANSKGITFFIWYFNCFKKNTD